jgi:uncharacterized protein YjbI with pentapeptide repeats
LTGQTLLVPVSRPDISGGSLLHTILTGANLSADTKNQSMGLMRAVLRSANLSGADLRQADLSRADLEFASLTNANLTGASLRGALLGGANLTGVTVSEADFSGADLASARLVNPIGLEAAKNFEQAINLDRLLRE